MATVTPEFTATVERLISQLSPGPLISEDECRIGHELHALPIGVDLYSYIFLSPAGATIWVPIVFEEDEVSACDKQDGFERSVIIAAEIYPDMVEFVPSTTYDP